MSIYILLRHLQKYECLEGTTTRNWPKKKLRKLKKIAETMAVSGQALKLVFSDDDGI